MAERRRNVGENKILTTQEDVNFWTPKLLLLLLSSLLLI